MQLTIHHKTQCSQHKPCFGHSPPAENRCFTHTHSSLHYIYLNTHTQSNRDDGGQIPQIVLNYKAYRLLC